jgi:type II secretory ATPase GspE/PulE/Tfp pilus assembly ATPase PilB-like protein
MDQSNLPQDIQRFQEEEKERLAQRLADLLGINYFNLQYFKPETEALSLISEENARRLKIIPIKKEYKKLYIGVFDPTNEEVQKFLESLKESGYEPIIGVISETSFEEGLKFYQLLAREKFSYRESLEIRPEVIEEVENKIKNREEIKKLVEEVVMDRPFVALDIIFAGALKFDASDIHFEPEEKIVRVRYRLDGILYEIAEIPKIKYLPIKNRIKLASKLYLNITTQAQDGRFSLVRKGYKLDIRVSTVPGNFDETIVMRILDIRKVTVGLENLGMRKDDFEVLSRIIRLPNGMILNTGPTGSGKTTTLYSILLTIKSPEIKIITIEDPIEYQIEGISQTQVDPKRGYTFALGLRAALRQDPDVVLVGEIRDEETANTAINAALTGHLVLSTLHTNDSLGAIPRLVNLGVDRTLIPPALRLVIAQRLVRKVCQYCKEEYQPDKELKEKIVSKIKEIPKKELWSHYDLENFTLIKGKGCEKCFNTGYKGRTGIFEFLVMTKSLEKIVYEEPSELKIFEEARKEGFVTLQEDALLKALNKITTIEEVERVTGIL